MIDVCKVSGPDAWRFVRAAITAEHRHHVAPVGWKWGYVASNRGRIVGVATVGRAVARWKTPTLELTRGCTWSRARYGAASAMLVAAARDAAVAGMPIVTYTLACETGASLEAAGWVRDGKPLRERAWTCSTRQRRSRPDEQFDKQRWRPGPQ